MISLKALKIQRNRQWILEKARRFAAMKVFKKGIQLTFSVVKIKIGC